MHSLDSIGLIPDLDLDLNLVNSLEKKMIGK